LTKKYVTFSGRARRPEYWWFALFVFLGVFLFGLLDAMIFGSSFGPGDHQATRVFAPLFQLATLLPFLAVGWRRMHDTGKPGWLLLLPLIVMFALSLVVAFGMLGMMSDGAAPMPGFGLGGFAVSWVIQIALFVLVVWWLTRPTQPGPNDYGPQPSR
jgi:uncharacterized membrane protein YhaH (DUF805 family)